MCQAMTTVTQQTLCTTLEAAVAKRPPSAESAKVIVTMMLIASQVFTVSSETATQKSQAASEEACTTFPVTTIAMIRLMVSHSLTKEVLVVHRPNSVLNAKVTVIVTRTVSQA